ncbi:hypothetical protein [Allokutzneria oryzae]|uniref:DUF2637 domain-containing protein n=1 Tax=Allokutzneria oryzae TaxID=1378989 RepID=A0ABV6A910_9PSEU
MSRRSQAPAAPGETRKVAKLRQQKAESQQLRGLVDDPDLNAVKIEATRRRITGGMWFFLALGLVFTTAGVQDFLAGDRQLTDPVWWAAWLVEPMVAGILIMLLRFETEVIARGIEVNSPRVDWLKRILLGSTLFMNVYPSAFPREGERDSGMVMIHALVPVVMYLVAEIMPVVQRRMRQAVLKGYADAARVQAEAEAADQAAPVEQARPVDPTTPTRHEDQADGSETAGRSAERPTFTVPRQVIPSAPAEAPAPKPAAVPGSLERFRLPASMAEAITTKATEVTASGRELTPEDVRAVARVPHTLAEQIAAALHRPVTGHAFS